MGTGGSGSTAAGLANVTAGVVLAPSRMYSSYDILMVSMSSASYEFSLARLLTVRHLYTPSPVPMIYSVLLQSYPNNTPFPTRLSALCMCPFAGSRM